MGMNPATCGFARCAPLSFLPWALARMDLPRLALLFGADLRSGHRSNVALSNALLSPADRAVYRSRQFCRRLRRPALSASSCRNMLTAVPVWILCP